MSAAHPDPTKRISRIGRNCESEPSLLLVILESFGDVGPFLNDKRHREREYESRVTPCRLRMRRISLTDWTPGSASNNSARMPSDRAAATFSSTSSINKRLSGA